MNIDTIQNDLQRTITGMPVKLRAEFLPWLKGIVAGFDLLQHGHVNVVGNSPGRGTKRSRKTPSATVTDVDVVNYIRKSRGVAISDIGRGLGVKTTTLAPIMRRVVAQKLVFRDGANRFARYGGTLAIASKAAAAAATRVARPTKAMRTGTTG